MIRQLFACAIFSLVLFQHSVAQQPGLHVFFKQTSANPGDTLVFGAQINLNGGPMKMGSLFLKVMDERGKVWDMRWPVFSGVMTAAIAIPKNFAGNHLHFFFSATTNFFTVTGTLRKPKKLKKLKVMLLTQENDGETEDIDLIDGSSFKYRYRVFEDEARIFFRRANDENEDLDIEIETPLDSPFAPLVKSYYRIGLGNNAKRKDSSTIDIDSLFDGRSKVLETVTVTGRKKTQAQEYQQQYVNGVFATMTEKTFDFLEDNKYARSPDILDFIKNKIPGVYIFRIPDESGMPAGARVVYRDAPVLFFIDQFETDYKGLMAVSMTDVAIIKFFPPPFAGAKMGNGAAIAVYTKRGKFFGGSPRHNFKVKGYSPPLTELTITPLP